MIRTYLCEGDKAGAAVIIEPADFYKHANTATVAPGRQTSFDFPGGETGDATQYDATVNEKIVPIYISSQAQPKGTALSGYKELSKALEVLPPKHLENIGKISANSVANPDDAYWTEKYGRGDFASAATADVKQGVAFFPWNKWPSIPQQYIDSTMLHEQGIK
jgi:type VI secretion system secreted protein VgrG